MNESPLPLYIGNLPENITETELSKFFESKQFKLSKIVLGKPRNNGRQFAFVHTNSNEASKILEQLNYENIQGKEITIMKYNSEATKIRLDLNIFVKNLPPNITSRDLHDKIQLLCPKATIESAKVGIDKNGGLMNYGYVHFNKSCESIVKELIQKGVVLMNGKEVEIKEYKKRSSETTNIYLKEFPTDWNADSIMKWIDGTGVKSASTYIPEKDGSLKGFAFADFGTYDKAINFISKVCQLTMNEVKSIYTSDDSRFRSVDHSIYISRALSRRERNSQLMRKLKIFKKELREKTRNKNLYVNNFPEDYDDIKLRTLFAEYGKITSSKVMLNEDGKSKGFGFVCFESVEDAKRAINGRKDYTIGSKKLTVCIAESKNARRKRLSQQFLYNQIQHTYPINFGPMPPQTNPIMPNYRPRMAPYVQPQFPPVMPRQIPMQYQPMQPPHYIQTPPPQPVQPKQRDYKDYNMILNNKSPEEQKDLLGEIIYKIASKEDVDTAPKITGMLLELDINDILYNLNLDNMTSKIIEARNVLRETKV